MPTGVIRKPKPGLAELGGLTRVFVYEVDQFVADTDFPTRSLTTTGEISSLGLLSSPTQSASRLVFDVKEAEPKSDGKTSATQFSFLHSLAGKVAGYTKEKYATVDTYMGKDLLIVAQRPNGDRVLLGNTYKPLRMQISDTLGKEADAYVGSDISFMQVDAVDFRPPLLAPSIAITSVAVPVYA
jgi:hypothetical protein